MNDVGFFVEVTFSLSFVIVSDVTLLSLFSLARFLFGSEPSCGFLVVVIDDIVFSFVTFGVGALVKFVVEAPTSVVDIINVVGNGGGGGGNNVLVVAGPSQRINVKNISLYYLKTMDNNDNYNAVD
jgi:hypothetical protein